MAQHTLIAVFGSEAQASQARLLLVTDGLDERHVTISTDLTSDGIAAEVPGQAYENQASAAGAGLRRWIQSGFTSAQDEDSADARRMSDVQRGSVVLSVSGLRSADCERIAALLKAQKAIAVRRC